MQKKTTDRGISRCREICQIKEQIMWTWFYKCLSGIFFNIKFVMKKVDTILWKPNEICMPVRKAYMYMCMLNKIKKHVWMLYKVYISFM